MKHASLPLLIILLLLLFNSFNSFGQTYWADYAKGSELLKNKKFKEAVEILEKAKVGAKKNVGDKNFDYAAIIVTLARSYEGLGENKIAESLYIENTEVWKYQNGADHYNYATTLISLGVFYQNTKQFEKAENTLIKSRDIYIKQLGKKHTYYAASLQALASLYSRMSRYEEAEPLYETVLKLRKQNEGENHIYFSEAIKNLATLYVTMEKYEKALFLYEKLLKIQESKFGENHIDYAKILVDLASVKESLKQNEEAEELYLKALKIKKEKLGRVHPEVINSLNQIALFYLINGRYKEAEPLYQNIIEVRRQQLGENAPLYAGSLISLAYLYHSSGRYTDAEPLYLEGLKILKSELGVNNLDYAKTLNYLGNLYQYVGRFEEAGKVLKEASSIYKTKLGEKHLKYINSLRSLAGYYWATNKHQEAEKLFLKVVEIYKSQLGDEHLNYAYAIKGLAGFYVAIKKYKEANPLQEKALNIIKKLLGENHPVYISGLQELARLYQGLNRIEEAESLYKKVLYHHKEKYGEQHSLYITSLRHLATFYHDLERFDEAELLYQEVSGLNLKQTKMFFSSWSEREKRQYWKNYSYQYDIFHSFAIKRYSTNPEISKAVYNNQLATKALLLNTTMKMKQAILNSNDTSLIEEYQQWQIKKNKLVNTYNLSVNERKLKGLEIKEIEKEINKIEKSLSAKSNTFLKDIDTISYTFKDVSKKLNAKEAAVEIVRFRWYNKGWADSVFYAAYITTFNSKYPELVYLKNGNELEKKYLKFYTSSIRHQLEDTISYSIYWGAIADKLKNINKVFLSLDGVYNQINLNTLYNNKSGKYLLDEIEIHLVTNTKELLLWEREEDQTAKTALLIGRPDYKIEPEIYNNSKKPDSAALESNSYTRSASWLQGGNFQDLPGTEKEIESISTILNNNSFNYELLLKEKALEEEIKRVKSPKIIHIATHGFFIPAEESFLIIEERETTEKEKIEFRGFIAKTTHKSEDPMLRSGIVLAGVTNYYEAEKKPEREDGILTAYEATTLKLGNTELVVLSACETGKGEVSAGEGVYGLQRGLKVAGAKSILMSLWKVDDAATQELMTNFYKYWIKKGKNKRTAFLKAQDQLKKKYEHPYYWGAFVMVGE